MSQFNVKASEKFTETNYEGEVSYKLTPEMKLYSLVCASALQPTFYIPNTNDQLNRIKSALRKVDPVFAAKLAVYVREKMYLRTIPLVLTVELAKIYKGKDDLIRRLTRRVIQRADEITEVIAYYVKANKKEPLIVETKGNHTTYKTIHGLSNQLKKGIKDVFESGVFNEYNYSKYNRNTEIKLRDVLFLTHPKPKDQYQKDLFNKMANNVMETPYTWEVELSKTGKEGDKKQTWEDLIDSGKMGYMALIRNLRNFVKEGVSSSHIHKVAERLSDYEQVKRSKQLPFRFLSAYRALGQKPKGRYMYWDYIFREGEVLKNVPNMLLEALERAVRISIENIPMFDADEGILIATDVSGSMQDPVSQKSQIMYYDIGAILALLLQSHCYNSTIGMFGNEWKVLNDLPKDSILRATNELHAREGEVGYSTNGWKVLKWCIDENKHFDRIMIFTDCQMWNSSNIDSHSINSLWKVYKKVVPRSKLYLFDLSSYGSSPIDMREGDVNLITGWSERIFDVLWNIERGGNSLDEIKEIVL